MNRFHWTYVDTTGRKNQIGIVHFPKRSGHLLIYINSKISVVDFKIFESKTYSIFIEGELCEISIEKKGTEYFYGFDINKEADTPHNQSRKKEEQQHLWKALGLAVALLLVIGVAVCWNSRSAAERNRQAAKALTAENSHSAVATVFDDGKEVSYSFVVGSQVMTQSLSPDKKEDTRQKTGFPLANKDEFLVLYAPQNPQINRLDITQPSATQLRRYVDRARSVELKNNPQIDSTRAACYLQLAYEMRGLAGLALFYHQNTAPTADPVFNSDAYKRLVRSEAFKEAANKVCFE